TSAAGGDATANGKLGFGSGNMGSLPVSLPAALHGFGVAGVGNASGQSEGLTDSRAGGRLRTTGEGGTLSGNIAHLPTASAVQSSGIAAAVAGLSGARATDDLVSTADGTAQTNGDGGSISGNVLRAQAQPIAQV